MLILYPLSQNELWSLSARSKVTVSALTNEPANGSVVRLVGREA